MRFNKEEKRIIKDLLFSHYGDLKKIIKHSKIPNINNEFELFKYIQKNSKYFELEKLFNYISYRVLSELKSDSLKGKISSVGLYVKIKKILDEKIKTYEHEHQKVKKELKLIDQRELLLSKLYSIAVSTNNDRLMKIYQENYSSYSDKDNNLVLLLPYDFMDDESKTNNDI